MYVLYLFVVHVKEAAACNFVSRQSSPPLKSEPQSAIWFPVKELRQFYILQNSSKRHGQNKSQVIDVKRSEEKERG